MLDALRFKTFNLQLNLKFVFSDTAIFQKLYFLIPKILEDCPQADLNNRPLHYKCNALPLSYRGGIVARFVLKIIFVKFSDIISSNS